MTRKKSKAADKPITSMTPQEIDARILKLWKKLKGPEFEIFVNYAKKLGARIFVRFPDGRELELPLPSFPTSTQPAVEE